MEEAARYECVYNPYSKNVKDKNKKANSWEKIGQKFNLSCLFMNIFQIQNWCFFRFWNWRCRRFWTKKEINLLASTTRVYIWHFRWTKSMATVGSAIVCDPLRLYGNSSLCDRLRSYGNQPYPTFRCAKKEYIGSETVSCCSIQLLVHHLIKEIQIQTSTIFSLKLSLKKWLT